MKGTNAAAVPAEPTRPSGLPDKDGLHLSTTPRDGVGSAAETPVAATTLKPVITHTVVPAEQLRTLALGGVRSSDLLPPLGGKCAKPMPAEPVSDR